MAVDAASGDGQVMQKHLDSSADPRTHQPCRRGRERPAGEARETEWTCDSTSDVILEMPAPGAGLDDRTRALVDALVEIAFRTLAGGNGSGSEKRR